jgi:ankyrin repeat and BTB/POZ domain-containing protein 1
MDEDGELHPEAASVISNAADALRPGEETTKAETTSVDPALNPFMNGEIRTLDGDVAGDEFAADAINYQVLLGKIDSLLERLKLDA